MKLALTDAIVATLQFDTQTDVWDLAMPGLILRVAASGSKSWQVRLRRGGKRYRRALGRFPGLSSSAARAKAAMAMDEPPGGQPERQAASLGEALSAFEAEAMPLLASSTQAEWTRLIRVEIRPALGALEAGVARPALRAMLDALVLRGSPYTANRAFEVVRRVTSWAVQRELLPATAAGLTAGMQPPAVELVRMRVLSDDELGRVLRAIDGEPLLLSVFWKLAIYTGQRRGEILSARWEQFDLDGAVWRLHTKGGKPHVLGLPRQAVEALRQASIVSGRSEFVCQGPAARGYIWNPQKTTARIRLRSGVSFRIHDVRRTVASGLARLGVREGLVSRILNHSSSEGATITSRVYNLYAYVDEMRDALQLWADHTHQCASRGWPQPSSVSST